MEQTKKKGLLRRVWDGYSKFCQDIGVEKGGGRGCCCVPVVKFDETWSEEEKAAMKRRKNNKNRKKTCQVSTWHVCYISKQNETAELFHFFCF